MPNVTDDDFIFTISDHDDISDDNDDEAPTTAAAAKLAGQGKKRKFAAHIDDTAIPATEEREERGGKKARRGKKSKKGSENAEQEEREEGDRGEGVVVDDDGDDMASDFEFQIGDVEGGVVEGFDGWGVGVGVGLGSRDVRQGERGGKKSTAVDVDEIIERRSTLR